MILAVLFAEFFKIGLFAVGGGLATLPFLFHLADKYPWLTPEMIPDIQAVAQSAPGAVGVNMAAYTGFRAAGIAGAAVAVLGEIAPEIIVIAAIARVLAAFKGNKAVEAVFSGLRPAAVCLLAAACYGVIGLALWAEGAQAWYAGFRWRECALFAVLFALIVKFKLHPFFYIALAGAAGVAFAL